MRLATLIVVALLTSVSLVHAQTGGPVVIQAVDPSTNALVSKVGDAIYDAIRVNIIASADLTTIAGAVRSGDTVGTVIDSIIMLGARRTDNPAVDVLSIDNARTGLTSDQYGYLHVTLSANPSAQPNPVREDADLADNSVFTPNTSRVLVQGATVDDLTPSLVLEGRAGGLRMSTNRNLYSQIRDGERAASVTVAGELSTVDTQLVRAFAALTQQQGYVKGTFGTKIASVGDSLKVFNTSPQDPCSGVAKINVAISQTATSLLVKGIPGMRIFVCAARVVAGTAEIVNFTEGTGTTCGTSETAVSGSTTAANGESYAANTGFAEAAAVAIMLTNKAGDDLCLKQSTSNRLSGNLVATYVP